MEKIERIDDSTIIVDGRVYSRSYIPPHNVEFEVGDWICTNRGEFVSRIKSVESNMIRTTNGFSWFKHQIRPLYLKEIGNIR